MAEPRSRDQVLAVLRYWLAAVQAEASISARPRAHRRGGPGTQAYFRLGAEHAALIAGGTGEAILPMDGALSRFLNRWMRTERRREKLSHDAVAPEWSLGWPTFYFEGYGRG